MVLVMCESEPNSVFSGSDVESKEVLTSRSEKKKKVGTSFGKLFDMCDHYYFRKKSGFL